MFILFPTIEDKVKQLKHNNLISYILFRIFIYFIVVILAIKGFINLEIHLTTSICYVY